MVIRIVDIAGTADTTKNGVDMLKHLTREFDKQGDVIVSFEGISVATSSFVNAAFLPILARISVAEMKRRLKVVGSNRQINEMIKRCIAAYDTRHLAGVTWERATAA